MDWSRCSLVEIKPEIQGGAPILRGTRMPVDAIIDNFDYGVSVKQISELFEISQDQITAVLAYAENERVAGTLR